MAESVSKNSGNDAYEAKPGAGGGQFQSKPPLQQAQDIADHVLAAGRDLKDRAIDLAGSSAEAVKEQASEFTDAAKEFASQAGEKLKDGANAQKNAGATYIGNIADTMRRAAHEFENDLPIAAVYIHKAASRVEDISDTVQHGDIQDLINSAQAFARRQPTAFLGLAVLAGFGAVRFLKSSAGRDRTAEGSAAAAAQSPRGHRDDSAS